MSILQNRYGIIYYSIIEKARYENRSKKDDYYETHHIVPRSMGGTNQKTNLVLLTAREHYIVHLLLVRCVEKHNTYKMIAALARFKKQAESGRSYELFRRTMSKYSKGELNKSFGKIWIHNKETLDIKYVLKEEFEKMPNTWVKGLPYQRGGWKNRKWIFKGNDRTLVDPSEVNAYIQEGWTLGNNIANKPDHYKKMASARHTPEKDTKHSQKLTGKIAMRLPDENKVIRVNPEQVEELKNQGYILQRGSGLKMITSAGRKCFIDGKIFDSVSKASQELGVQYQRLIAKIKSDKWPNYYYVES